MTFIFGGDTGISYDQLKKKRELVDELRAQNNRAPRNVGEGIHAIARSLVARGVSKQADAERKKMDDAWNAQIAQSGMDPTRAAIFSRMAPEQRDIAWLREMERQEAERRRMASAGAAASQNAAISQALMQSLQGRQTAIPGVQMGPTQAAAEAGAVSGADLSALQTQTTPYSTNEQIALLLAAGADPSQAISTVNALRGLQPDPMDGLRLEQLELSNEAARRELAQEPTRRIIQGADGFNYYEDTQERVLPNVQTDPMGALQLRRQQLENEKLERELSGPVNPNVLDKEQMAQANTLRDDFRTEAAEQSDILNGFTNIHNALSQPGSVSDVQLAVSFTKVLDPGSVAREGEVAVITSAAGLGERLTAALNQALTGRGALTPGQREQIYKLAYQKYVQSADAREALIERYATIAERQGIPREDVVSAFKRLNPYEQQELLARIALFPGGEEEAPPKEPMTVEEAERILGDLP